jgi:hypothetical protein
MSKLIIKSLNSKVEFKEDTIERKLNFYETFTEIINKRFEGSVTFEFESSGDLTGWTAEQIGKRIAEVLINDYIPL